ncbi:MAG: hypothetical protein JXA87_04730 [Thermoleophilia bacterium]|nr:hypothetical protein [Thermoleophilia bacterium]
MWIAKMARWLPYHQDNYFLGIRSAVWAKEYRPRFESPVPATPQESRAAADRELDTFARRGDRAIRAFQAFRKRRRR